MVNTSISRLSQTALQQLLTTAQKDLFFTIALLAAGLTSLFGLPKAEYIDYKVILSLFELMIIVKAFEEYALLQRIAVGILKGCGNERLLTQALCLISFVFAMFVTNDVALLTIVPIIIVIAQRSGYDMLLPSVLVTIAANLGSSLTPIGNPQNLYLFSFYDLKTAAFFSRSLPLGVAGLVLVLGLSFFIRPRQIAFTVEEVPVTDGKRLAVFVLLAVLVVLSVVGVVHPLLPFFVVMAAALTLNRSLLKRADYRLLLTFVCIFIAIGNITHWPALRNLLATLTGTPAGTYVTALLTSQIISNVPATVLLAPFAKSSLALFNGVNIGGLGTPIASLASVITYRLFANQCPHRRKEFLGAFSVYNFGCLVLLGVVFYVAMVM